MANYFYEQVAPDAKDVENTSGERPGHLLQAVENKGGVEIWIYPSYRLRPAAPGDGVFLNMEEAEEYIAALQQALEKARNEGITHPNRVRDPIDSPL